LIVFATGAPVRFGDRPKVEAILDRAATKHYGVKSLIQAIIESELLRFCAATGCPAGCNRRFRSEFVQ
jgi:hypothetical protein